MAHQTAKLTYFSSCLAAFSAQAIEVRCLLVEVAWLVQIIGCRLAGAKSLFGPMIEFCLLDPWNKFQWTLNRNLYSHSRKRTSEKWRPTCLGLNVLSWEWHIWSSTDRRCCNFIWVINNFIGYWGAAYIRVLTVIVNGYLPHQILKTLPTNRTSGCSCAPNEWTLRTRIGRPCLLWSKRVFADNPRDESNMQCRPKCIVITRKRGK